MQREAVALPGGGKRNNGFTVYTNQRPPLTGRVFKPVTRFNPAGACIQQSPRACDDGTPPDSFRRVAFIVDREQVEQREQPVQSMAQSTLESAAESDIA